MCVSKSTKLSNMRRREYVNFFKGLGGWFLFIFCLEEDYTDDNIVKREMLTKTFAKKSNEKTLS